MGDRWTTRGGGRGWFRPGHGQRALGQSPHPVPAGGPDFLSDGIRRSPADCPERVRVRRCVSVRCRIIVPGRIWGGAGIRIRIRDREHAGIPVADYACVSELIPVPIPIPTPIAFRISIPVGVRLGFCLRLRLRVRLGLRLRVRLGFCLRFCVRLRFCLCARVAVGAADNRRQRTAAQFGLTDQAGVGEPQEAKLRAARELRHPLPRQP